MPLTHLPSPPRKKPEGQAGVGVQARLAAAFEAGFLGFLLSVWTGLCGFLLYVRTAVVFDSRESSPDRAAKFGVACEPADGELAGASDVEENPLETEAPAEEECCCANTTIGISRKAIEGRRGRRIEHLRKA